MNLPVAVVGGGMWGRALATRAVKSGQETFLYSRREGDEIPGVTTLRSLDGIGKRARLFFIAAPPTAVRIVASELAEHIDGRHAVVHAVRGWVHEPLTTVSSVLRDELPTRKIGVLGGPALAEELLSGAPSVLVVASSFRETTDWVTEALRSPSLRVYSSSDLVGIEWSSALMGSLAIAVGYAKEAGVHAGLLAALVCRAVDESARLVVAAGGTERSILGLAGYGDLLASTEQADRPEVKLGELLARGHLVDAALREVGERVDSALALPAVRKWAKERGIETPIFDAIEEGMFTGIAPSKLIDRLMATTPQPLH